MPADPAPRSTGFLVRYAIAHAGGMAAFLPLLTLLLPIKIASAAGPERLGWLTTAAVLGAIAASGSNILFGMLSDRAVAAGRTRRGWVFGGLVATAASYGVIAVAHEPSAIIAAIILFQFALNALLAPLHAMMSDEVPDAQKGTAGGLLSLAQPIASALSAPLVAMAWLGEAGRLAALCAAFTLLIAPLLLSRGRLVAEAAARAPSARADRWNDFSLAWGSRLLVQTSGNVLFFYLLYYFVSIAPQSSADRLAPSVAAVIAIGYALAAPVAVAAGRVSDRLLRRKPFVAGAALAMVAGLLTMALAGSWSAAVVGFCLYACGNACFLGLHTALTMQVLPAPAHRGRDLGIINLSNTLPAILGPAITWILVEGNDFSGVFALLALLCAVAGAIVLAIRSER